MHESDDICINRAHRIGKKQNGKKAAIVDKLNTFQLQGTVREHAQGIERLRYIP